eukprot:scaffold3254_cov267-Chaetoceros_neogracile.AAC.3
MVPLLRIEGWGPPNPPAEGRLIKLQSAWIFIVKVTNQSHGDRKWSSHPIHPAMISPSADNRDV